MLPLGPRLTLLTPAVAALCVGLMIACRGGGGSTVGTPTGPTPTPVPLVIPEDARVTPPREGPVPSLDEGLYILDLVSGDLSLVDPYGRAPAWSPHGERLAYGVSLGDDPSRSRDLGCWPGVPVYCGLAILLADPDRDGPPLEVGLGEAPSWDHTGTRLLYATRIWSEIGSRERGEIHVFDVESTQDTVLATHGQSGSGLGKSPLWSHDEALVLYSHGNKTYKVAADGTPAPEPVTDGSLVAVSPVDDSIAVARTDKFRPQSRIWITSLDDPEDERFFAATFEANWSPDGRFLTYRISGSGGRLKLVMREIALDRPVRLDPPGWSSSVWSADGSMFAYSARVTPVSPEAAPMSDIYLTSGDGSALPVRLTSGAPVAWLPDSSGLIVSRDGGLELVGLDGSAHTLVESVPGCTSVSVSPDGTQLAISAYHCRF